MKKNFRTVILLFAVFSVVLLMGGIWTKDGQLRKMLFWMSAVVAVSLVFQLLLFAIKPGLFRDRSNQS
ncbi:MAG TPA: hypothetical protein VGM24_00540 [Puia sp.]